MKQPIFITMAGYVRSTDGDEHFISDEKLIKLYGVPKELVIKGGQTIEKVNTSNLIKLSPSINGDYTLFTAIRKHNQEILEAGKSRVITDMLNMSLWNRIKVSCMIFFKMKSKIKLTLQ